MTARPTPTVVLVSGRGSNLQAILDDNSRDPVLDIRHVVSNQTDAPALDRARRAGIAASALDHRRFASRAEFDTALMTAIDADRPALVVLAGFMRVLTGAFVTHYDGRLLNIHPALLPAFVLSELKVAFLIGFQIYLPFLIIDLVVASVSTSLGMMMLPPTMISLPLKLVMFVLVDGWHLVVQCCWRVLVAR